MEMKITPHINPKAEIAPRILLPGDPLRAKYIAENMLENAEQFNEVRGALGFTGTYKGCLLYTSQWSRPERARSMARAPSSP